MFEPVPNANFGIEYWWIKVKDIIGIPGEAAIFNKATTPPFEISDEIYQFRAPYSRTLNRVLLSLDISGTDMTKKGITRKDGDFAVAWVHPAGKGRYRWHCPQQANDRRYSEYEANDFEIHCSSQ